MYIIIGLFFGGHDEQRDARRRNILGRASRGSVKIVNEKENRKKTRRQRENHARFIGHGSLRLERLFPSNRIGRYILCGREKIVTKMALLYTRRINETKWRWKMKKKTAKFCCSFECNIRKVFMYIM